MTRRSLAAWLVPLLLLGAAVAHAQLAERRLGVGWRGGIPRVTFSARDLVNRRVREDLERGINKRIVLTVQAFREGGGAPIATRRLACGVYWDVWEEVFRVRIGQQRFVEPALDGVLARCLVVRDMALGDEADWQRHRGRRVYFAARAEYNPMTNAQCRALLRPSGSDDPIGPVVINIVRRQICAAERAVEFQSPEHTVP